VNRPGAAAAEKQGTSAAARPPSGSRRAIALVLVAAVADNGVIGQGGALPWRLRSDLRHFRAATLGKPVVMGRKTYLSIGKPLAGRTNIVVSRDPRFAAAGAVVAASLSAALEVARADALRRGADAIAVVGGADVYAQTMQQADRLLITRVHLAPAGDTMFPPIDSRLWRETERTEHAQEPDEPAGFSLLVYERPTTHFEANVGGP
jgi:dihydrofolate reductase